jgi:hypothetical protein
MIRKAVVLSFAVLALFLLGGALGAIAAPESGGPIPMECFEDICRNDQCSHEPPFAYFCSDTTGECKMTECYP